MIILPERILLMDHPTLAIGAVLRVLLLVLVLVLTIPATKVVLLGLRILVVVLPLGIQVVMAIRAVTPLPQGMLVVLETILLAPLVTTQNHPQATEGCKRRMTYDPCNLRLLVFPALLTCACATSDISPSSNTRPSATWFSRILVKSTTAITHSPIILYLTYLLTFDPVLHLFPLFPSTSKVSYHPSYDFLLLLLSTPNI